MPPPSLPSINAESKFDFALRAAWLFRWLLVLLLIFDQVGAPLHRHHHDSGIDSSSMHSQAASGSPRFWHHIEEDKNDPSLFHSVTTVRAESHDSAPDLPPPSDSPKLTLAYSWAMPWRDLEVNVGPSWADADEVPHPLHRSLPPAGRAPPRRA